MKLLFEIGKLLFRQNNFKESIKVFESIVEAGKKFDEDYFVLLSFGFMARAKLRLGTFKPE